MAESKDETIQAIAKLIKLTQEGVLKWNVTDPWGDLINREDFEVLYVFSSSYKEQTLRFYGYRHRIEDPGPFDMFSTAITATSLMQKQRKYPYWDSDVRLELIDGGGRMLWRFPSHSALYDLLKAIRYQVANVGKFLRDLASD